MSSCRRRLPSRQTQAQERALSPRRSTRKHSNRRPSNPKPTSPTTGRKSLRRRPPRRTHSRCGGGRRFLCPSRFLRRCNAESSQERLAHIPPASSRSHQMGRCFRRSSEQSASPAAFSLRWLNHADSACTGSPAGSRPADRHARGSGGRLSQTTLPLPNTTRRVQPQAGIWISPSKRPSTRDHEPPRSSAWV
jgi:hypothetical protein